MMTRPTQIAVAFFLLRLCQAPAAVFYVDLNSTNPTPPYATWSTASTNIQPAVELANSGDTVLVTDGVYNTGGTLTSDGSSNQVVVSTAVTLQSVHGSSVTSINGGGTARCVYLTDGALLKGFTLTNGFSAESGGGAFCSSTNARLANCLLLNNVANTYGGGNGGGVCNGTLDHCTLAGNSAESGGAATASTLNACTLSGNYASDAGGAASSGTLNRVFSELSG